MKSINILLTLLYTITGYPGYDTGNLKSIINDAVTASATGTSSETTSTVCDYTI